MTRSAAKHANWIAPAAASFDPYEGSYLKAGRVAGATEDARDVMRGIDQVAVYFPVTTDAILLQKWIFEAADALGVKPQVEYVVYALRAASGASQVAAASVATAAANAGLSAASVGAIAAVMPLAGAAVAVVAFLSGGGDEDARRKDAQRQIQRLRDRHTLAELAAEQRSSAQDARALAKVTAMYGPGAGAAKELDAKAEVAERIAKLYDRARKELPTRQAAILESLSNLARWRAVLASYADKPQSEKDAFDSIGFGTSAPRLPYQLKGKVAAEEARLAKLAAGAPAPSSALGTALIVGSAAGALYLLAPGAAIGVLAGIWAGARRVAGYATEKVKGAIT